MYEDDDIVLINKPSGLVIHPGAGNTDNTLVNALLYYYKNLRVNYYGNWKYFIQNIGLKSIQISFFNAVFSSVAPTLDFARRNPIYIIKMSKTPLVILQT